MTEDLTTTTTTTRPRCRGVKKDGSPCGATPTKSGWCPFHDPDRTLDQALWRREGGRTRIPATLPDAPDPTWSTPEDVQRSVVETHGLATRGELSSDLANVRLKAADTWMRIWESQQLREQLEALEALAGQKLKRGWG